MEPDLIGPQQRGSTSWSAKVTHGLQQLLQGVVVIDDVCREHVVVVAGEMGKVPLQVLTPGEGRHLGGVAAAALGVSQKVKGQIRQDVRQVGGCHPSPWTREEKNTQLRNRLDDTETL